MLLPAKMARLFGHIHNLNTGNIESGVFATELWKIGFPLSFCKHDRQKESYEHRCFSFLNTDCNHKDKIVRVIKNGMKK